MQQIQATIIARETVAPVWWRFIISAPELSATVQPGQFLFVRCGDVDTCYLRRPIFPQHLEDGRLAVLLRPDSDPGLAWLLARQAGDTLDLIGPLGTGFSLPNSFGNLLLVSDGQTLGPLLGQMARGLKAGFSVTMALGGSRASTLFPLSDLPLDVEFRAATRDGSRGHRGDVTDLLPDLVQWADMICAVGSVSLYQSLLDQAASIRFGLESNFIYGLIQHYPIACGLGACLSCAIKTDAGIKLNCLDGPVFDLTMLLP